MNLLKHIRERRNLSVRETARICDTSASTISIIENDLHPRISSELIERIFTELSVPTIDIDKFLCSRGKVPSDMEQLSVHEITTIREMRIHG